jgi:hypothetical protein
VEAKPRKGKEDRKWGGKERKGKERNLGATRPWALNGAQEHGIDEAGLAQQSAVHSALFESALKRCTGKCLPGQ